MRSQLLRIRDKECIHWWSCACFPHSDLQGISVIVSRHCCLSSQWGMMGQYRHKVCVVCCVCVCTVWLFVCTAAPQTSFHDSKGYPTLSPWSLVSLPSPPPTPRHSLLLKFTTYMWLSWTECCCVGVWRQDGPSRKRGAIRSWGERRTSSNVTVSTVDGVCSCVCVWTGGHFRVKATPSRQNLSVSDCCQPEPQRTLTITGVWNIYNENNCRKDWKKMMVEKSLFYGNTFLRTSILNI